MLVIRGGVALGEAFVPPAQVSTRGAANKVVLQGCAGRICFKATCHLKHARITMSEVLLFDGTVERTQPATFVNGKVCINSQFQAIGNMLPEGSFHIRIAARNLDVFIHGDAGAALDLSERHDAHMCILVRYWRF